MNAFLAGSRILLPNHQVVHAKYTGLKGLQNGALLKAAEAEYDILITIDKNMSYQQSLKGLRIAVVIFNVRERSEAEFRNMAAKFEVVADQIKPGTFLRIDV